MNWTGRTSTLPTSNYARPRIEAVLFDLNGTLANDEVPWFEECGAVYRRHTGRDMTWRQWWNMGSPHASSIIQLIQERVPEAPTDVLRRELREAAVAADRKFRQRPWMPGALEFLEQTKASGRRIGIVTNGSEQWWQSRQSALGIEGLSTVVTSSRFGSLREKPAPTGYLTAAIADLNLAPNQVLAVENTPAGARSAQAAGCFTMTVDPNLSESTDLEVDFKAPTLEGLKLDWVCSRLSSAPVATQRRTDRRAHLAGVIGRKPVSSAALVL